MTILPIVLCLQLPQEALLEWTDLSQILPEDSWSAKSINELKRVVMPLMGWQE
jgi:hypothetical protein